MINEGRILPWRIRNRGNPANRIQTLSLIRRWNDPLPRTTLHAADAELGTAAAGLRPVGEQPPLPYDLPPAA